MYQTIVMLFLLATSTASVSGVPSCVKILASKGFTTEELRTSTWEFNVQVGSFVASQLTVVLLPFVYEKLY